MEILPIALTREQVIHSLYEAAELEHNLMCTYLYAAFSLKEGQQEGLSPAEAEAVSRWRRTLLSVAVDEMSHLVAVWNITAAIGGTPRFGRTNFPLEPGMLPAGIVVKLAPFSEEVLQHFVYLERPANSAETDGSSFTPHHHNFLRGASQPRVTPMAMDYTTVGEFYHTLQQAIAGLAALLGERVLFCGDPHLQLSEGDIALPGARKVLCAKTAVAAFDAIVNQGEGAHEETADSHYCRFRAMRDELRDLKTKNPAFEPAHPAACNPVLRRPPKPEGRVFLEDPTSSAIVDVANASYQTMLRMLAYAYTLDSRGSTKALTIDLAIALMKAFTWLAESAARRPAGPASPGVNAGVSFTTLRDSAPLLNGASGGVFLAERFAQLAEAAAKLDQTDNRVQRATTLLAALTQRTAGLLAPNEPVVAPAERGPKSLPIAPASVIENGVEVVQGEKLELRFHGKLCIHARFCVTQAPAVFLADVKGPWLYPDAMNVEELAAIARACPSGAIQYTRKDGGAEDVAPPVNLVSVRESGPYALRGELVLDGKAIGTRATLCRCGESKNKPYCDGSHGPAGFTASGEPPTGAQTAMLEQRNGPLQIAPQVDGPLSIRGNMEVLSGTGRNVGRIQSANFCRCGHSNTKPYCDGTHRAVGFRST